MGKKVTKRKASWQNEKINRMKKESNKLCNKFWKYKLIKYWDGFKIVKIRLNNTIWSAGKAYLSDNISSSKDPKEICTCLKRNDIFGPNGDSSILH